MIALPALDIMRSMKQTQPLFSSGFTLVEMAVVVALAGMLLAMGIAIANSAMDNTRRSVTKDHESLVKDAMVAYFINNHRFPCPDTGDNTGAGLVREGIENRVAGGVNPVVTTNCTSAFGTVPYRTLGLARDQALDAWGNFVSYRLDTARGWHLSATFPAPPAACPSIIVGLSVFSSPAVLQTGQAALVLIAHGANGRGAFNQGQTDVSRNGLPTTAGEFGNTQPNPAGPAGYRDYAYSDTAATPFDDITQFMTAGQLQAAMVKTGKATICS